MDFRLPVYDSILKLHDLALEIGGGLPGILHKDRILATGHGFTEDNKRTALLTMLATYNANGRNLKYSHIMNDEYRELVLWVVKESPHVKEVSPKLKELAEKYSPSALASLVKRLRGE